MKRRFGAKPAGPYMRSMPWIAVNPKKEGAAAVSMIGENCRPSKIAIVEFGASSGFKGRRAGDPDHDGIGPWLQFAGS
jgi:hypothetical protein